MYPSPAPVTGLTVDTDISASENLFGKTVSDLQTNIAINDYDFTGTLKYVDDYTGFSSDPALQSGNYLAIHCETTGSDPITVEVVGGVSGPVQLDPDGIIVLRIASNSQQIRVTSGSIIQTYSLTDLVLSNE